MFGIDPMEIKRLKRDLTTIETALIALLSAAREQAEDEAIKNMCGTSIKGLVRCAIDNTQDIVGDSENIAEKIFESIKDEQKKREAKTDPASS